jgi:hypothetical protein
MEDIIYIGIARCQKKGTFRGAKKRLNWLVVLILILGCTLVGAKEKAGDRPVFSRPPMVKFSKTIPRSRGSIPHLSGGLTPRNSWAKASPVSNYYYTNTHIAIDVTNNLQGANVSESNIGSVTVSSSAMPWPT